MNDSHKILIDMNRLLDIDRYKHKYINWTIKSYKP